MHTCKMYTITIIILDCTKCMTHEVNTILDLCGHKFCNFCVQSFFNNHDDFECVTCHRKSDSASYLSGNEGRTFL